MSVLPRLGRLRGGIDAVCFVKRDLVPEEIASLFNRVDDLQAGHGAPLLVIPCDAKGVCPSYANRLEEVRGLPAYFLGLRPSLRQHLARRYDVRAAPERERTRAHQVVLEMLHAEVERSSAALREVEALHRTIEDTVSREEERKTLLAALSGTIATAQDGLRAAIRRYQEAWLGRVKA